MSIVSPRATLRWKEWIPLITQQQRLRNLIQIIAYNIDPNEKDEQSDKTAGKNRYYFTLHLTTMSAPFYTSEKLESENPKWADIEISQANGAAKGVVIRLWCENKESPARLLTVWGVYFSGLTHLGPRLVSTDPSSFIANTLVLHMQGGYFTAPHCFRDVARQSATQRVESASIQPVNVRSSYSVSLLLRLHSIQQAIKQHSVAAASLRERIIDGGLSSSPAESTMLRRLLHRTKHPPHPRHPHTQAIKKELEEVRFRVNLLTHERDKKSAQLRQKVTVKNKLAEENQDKGLELMESYQNLHKDSERLKDLKQAAIDTREKLYMVNSMVQALKRKRIADLNIIYPIGQVKENQFVICGVHLPNSEDFVGHDEVMISVALGFVAHLIQMIAYFLHVPLRYPVIHAGSRSKIVDHITDKRPDNEREFPLYSRGKDKLQFNYGVYLLNKNIAQLRWYCSLTSADLRTTLPNLLALLDLKPSQTLVGLEANKRTLSSSTLELQRGGQNVRRVRIPASTAPLSSSLDKGLDQLSPCLHRHRSRSSTHNSSEPPPNPDVDPPNSLEDRPGQKEFLHLWAQGSAPHVFSDTEHESDPSLRQSPAPAPAAEESLASIINKINSPAKLQPRYNHSLLKTEPSVDIDPDDTFTRQSIHQVTSKHMFYNS